jgi:hypothetical protein
LTEIARGSLIEPVLEHVEISAEEKTPVSHLVTTLIGIGEVRGYTVKKCAKQRCNLTPSLIYTMFYCHIS